MAEKTLSVRLSAKDRLSKAFHTVSGAAGKVGGALKKMAHEGSGAVEGLTRKMFFLREALNTVASVARGLWDAFITPAINARKLTVSLANVFGEGTAGRIRKFSLDTGLAFETISKAALDMESQLGQAGGLDAYLAAIERVNAWRPDLGAEGAVSFVNDLVARVQTATEGSSKALGQYTSVMIGGTAAQAMDLSAELDKLGVVARVADPATSALDRLRAAWAKFAVEVGGRVLDKLAEGGLKLLDWLTQNEDKVLRLADAFARLINEGIQKLIDWIDSGGIDALIVKFGEWWEVIKQIWADFQPILQAAGKFLGQVGKGMGQQEAPGTFGQAVGQTVSRPRQAYERAVGTAGMGVGTAFGAVGGLFGQKAGARAALFGQGLGENLARGGNLITAGRAGLQNVQVNVAVDDEGALRAYVAQEGDRRNSEIFTGAGGNNNPQPAYGWR